MLFIFDENFPPEFVRGFSIIEKANKRSPFSVDIVFSPDIMGKQGSSDEEIIAKAAKKNAVIVTQDTDFKRIKHYKSLLIQNNVGYVSRCLVPKIIIGILLKQVSIWRGVLCMEAALLM
jgi:predicted nuclease of predicted toxin-antitoxin system